MDYSVVDRYEWHQRHVPQEILGCHDLIETHERPGLKHDSKEDVIMQGKSGGDDDTPLRNERQNGHDFARLHIVHLVNHVEIYRVVMSVVLSFKVVQVALI